jgi:hypothetical protein
MFIFTYLHWHKKSAQFFVKIQQACKITYILYFTYFGTGNLCLESREFKSETIVTMIKISVKNRVLCLHSEKGCHKSFIGYSEYISMFQLSSIYTF